MSKPGSTKEGASPEPTAPVALTAAQIMDEFDRQNVGCSLPQAVVNTVRAFSKHVYLATQGAPPAPVALTDEQISAAWDAWPRTAITSRRTAIEFVRALYAGAPPSPDKWPLSDLGKALSVLDFYLTDHAADLREGWEPLVENCYRAASAGAPPSGAEPPSAFDISTADLLLMCGEMTAGELRAVRAALNGLKNRARRASAPSGSASQSDPPGTKLL